ncbi:Protein of uncharacterised function (DUF1190) [Providencia rustigianii]|uniref:UPF0441 protein PROVRUST_06059 n=2 Tax=Providencia rustigianii TaxID=158850 RepID=D1P1I8_9GAMM|nr:MULTISPECIES: DUF1190 family protein [Providencia]EFB72774.1 hypothetical protein PROVRUST_06059 [Providencia rustigianii DSM 4541]MTC56657.1 DUF1190 family protein [Providencia rustigianii]MTC58911.1 DUF1190 family protein [Providencia rustigianii]SPY78691.1 Protein of uncharacterised function (DUF1190) [Providencia rustigianii]SUC28354.1 Protein of uncharacterised function (DUF1190) [Providencia rustigianii]
MTMKRTKDINQSAFRKSWRSYRLAPVAVAVSAVFMLSACEESDETVSLYTNAQDCSQANPSQAEQCTIAYNNALNEAAKTAPKYATQEDCIAEFGESMCTQAPAQAGIAGTSSTPAAGEQTAQAQSGGGSMWMPLMMGYMMGRMMGGSAASQPLFSSKNPASPANGKFVDATGKNYGPAVAGGRSMSVPKTAMAPKPATTSTVTRGGFGDTVNKQAMAQKSSSSAKSSSSSRSMGG